ncbi:MAG: response regulator transcription factor [Anaerolineaceae bacterium]|nr:response regulator transcription factor [Anaerolineaceae bacterium]
MIRVLICDDQEIVCEGLSKILSSDESISVVGTAGDGAEALEQVEKLQPDLVLMDLKMPGVNGIHATRQIRNSYPDTAVLILTTYDDDEWLFDAIRSGASGYLLKDTPRADLIDAIKGTVIGKTFVDPSVAGKLMSDIALRSTPKKSTLTALLTDRELEILILIAKGYNNADIAQRLFLSEGTVKNYSSTIFSKLNVTDRTQAAILAYRYGLIDIP